MDTNTLAVVLTLTLSGILPSIIGYFRAANRKARAEAKLYAAREIQRDRDFYVYYRKILLHNALHHPDDKNAAPEPTIPSHLATQYLQGLMDNAESTEPPS